MPESEHVAVRKEPTSLKISPSVSLAMALGTAVLLWHLALVLVTGLPLLQISATVQAGLLAILGRGSAVAVNGYSPEGWGLVLMMWGILALILGVVYVGGTYVIYRLIRQRRMAKKGDRGMSSAQQLQARAAGGGPDSARAPALFRYGSQPISLRTEDTGCTIAPPRWGKTAFMVAGYVKDAPGCVITTSTRPDVLRLTAGSRRSKGLVYVADFDGLSQYPNKVRWNMVKGCEDAKIATERAASMVSAMPRRGAASTTDDYFDTGCTMILQALLHAAAISGRTMRDVVRWSADFNDPEPANILRRKSPTVTGWARDLDEWCRENNPDTIGNLKTTLGKIIGPLKNEEVISLLCPSAFHQEIDLETFSENANTLYCLTRVSMTLSTAPIVTALVESLVQTAVRKSGKTVSGRLETHMSLILDEVANTAPLPSLPSLMSEGGGNNIHTFVFVQDYNQLVHRWGVEGAGTIFNSASAKVLFGGISDSRLLTQTADLVGKQWVEHTSSSTSTGKDGVPTTSSSRSMHLDHILRPDQIRKLSEGKVLLMYRELDAIVDVIPWWQRPDAEEFRQSRQWCLEQEGIVGVEAERLAAVEDAAEQQQLQMVSSHD